MADAAPETAPKKKGKMKKLLIMGVAVGGLVGGGVAGGIYAAGSGMVGGAHAEEKDPHRPKLVLREGRDGPEDGHPGKDGEDHSPDPHIYKASYYPLEQSFTANLVDTDGFLQVGLGVSTYYDEKVMENLKDNEMPVRSAILMVLADQQAETVSTPEGKARLQGQLRDAVNRTLRQKAGFGGINDVYFTTFVIQ